MGTRENTGARLRRIAAAAIVAASVVAATVVLAGVGRTAAAHPLAAAGNSRAAGPIVSQNLTTAVLCAGTVHRGETTTVSFRAADLAGGLVTMDLVVTTKSGEVVRTLVHGRAAPVGVTQKWRGRITLRTGRYLLVAHARDAVGRSEALATPAALRVLKALPPLVPTESARRAAFAWAARRAGRVAVAVIDSRGRLRGYHAREPFMSASVVKAVLLVAYLREHATVSAYMRGVLQRMIEYSDNDAADLVYRLVGRSGLERLARTTGMRGFRTTGAWITTRVTAADLALFFRDMEHWLPKRHRSFANLLLSHVCAYQSWGIPAAARPLGYRVYFKPGWLGAYVLAGQAARLERDRVRLGLAVFTDGNPYESYGKDTVAGVTRLLLRR